MTIEEELQGLGPLKNAAAVIVDYVCAGARQSRSKFQKYGYEWTLEPDAWINLNFIYIRKYRIYLSLGSPPAKLNLAQGLEIKHGKYPSWSKITISDVMQLPSALRCVEEAYYISSNKHRSRYGKPQRT
jgi:hypothetical protein